MGQMEISKLLDKTKLEKLKFFPDLYKITKFDLNNDNQIARIMKIRSFGKIIFLELSEFTSEIKDNISVCSEKNTTKGFENFKNLDLGDIIYFKKQINPKFKKPIILDWKIISKSLCQIPDKYKGLKDLEISQRQRYLACIYNKQISKNLRVRMKILKEIRLFLYKFNYNELDIPILETEYGGANSQPFTTQIKSLNLKGYLSISPELKLKQLIISGFDKIFTITHAFRNQDIDRTHNPEFLTLECYQIGKNYKDMINLFKEILKVLIKELNLNHKICYNNKILDLNDFKVIEFDNILKEFGILDSNYLQLSEKYGIPENITKGEKLLKLFDKIIVHTLLQPNIIINFPKESSPLCKQLDNNRIQQAEIYIAGMQVANIYSEENNPILQSKRLKQLGTSNPEFELACYYGMPTTGGIGIGLERILMILTDTYNLRESIPFPLFKSG
jgi:lysyl-tRNA synthetase class 2